MRNKIILVTGACGTFGKAFIKRILALGPKQVRLFSRDEYKQAKFAEELGVDTLHDPVLRFLCGDVRDYDRLVTATEGIDIVVHAAAMKRIEKCEYDPQEAVKTNIQGSINLVNACLKNNVKNAIALSTDKAVDPVSLYGATKMCMERLWIQGNAYRGKTHDTKFSLVRYGNVFGARGNVVEVFKEQKEKGVITVYGSEITRFFITIEHAIDLVLMALEYNQGGEIYIPQLKAFNIYELAEMMKGKAKIEVTHDRTTEKTHEAMYTLEEMKRISIHEGYNILHPKYPTWPYRHEEYVKRPQELETSGTVEKYSKEEIQDMLDYLGL